MEEAEQLKKKKKIALLALKAVVVAVVVDMEEAALKLHHLKIEEVGVAASAVHSHAEVAAVESAALAAVAKEAVVIEY